MAEHIRTRLPATIQWIDPFLSRKLSFFFVFRVVLPAALNVDVVLVSEPSLLRVLPKI